MKRLRIHGFTLIELLIVVAIIAILAAIAVPNFMDAQTRAKVTRIKADHRTIGTAIEMYVLDYRKCPVDWASWTTIPLRGNPFFNYFLPAETGDTEQFNVKWALVPLTTPQAFLTSLPDTAFTYRGNRHSGTGAANTIYYRSGRNHGSEYTTSEYTKKPLRLPDNPGFPYFCTKETGWTESRRWRLRDAGPDGYANNQLDPKEPYYTGSVYDPSNGSISSGDIVTWG